MTADRKHRLWIPGFVLLATALGLGFVWWWGDSDRQHRVMRTVMILPLAAASLLLWMLFLSGLRIGTRLLVLVSLLAAGGLAAALLEVRGVTGDTVPILGFRFAKPAEIEVDRSSDPEALTATLEPAPAWRDYPRFLGAENTATVSGVALARDWEESPPRRVWTREVGPSWSAFAVAGHHAVMQEQRGEFECVVSYRLTTGEERWIHTDRARYEEVVAGVGPRATPTIVGNRVYTLGATGILNCLDRDTGERIWSKDVLVDTGADPVEWGMSGSPLVLEQVVVVAAGGSPDLSVVAYDRETGERRWGGGSDGAGYGSPQLARLAGVPQILTFNAGSVSAVDPTEGRILWEVPWSNRNPNVAQPVVLPGDRFVVSAGYGVGAAAYEVGRADDGSLRAEQLWKGFGLKAKFSNFVHRDGFLYGLDDGIFACVEADTGRRRWKGGRYGHGQLIRVDDLLLVTGEFGGLFLLEATPEEHRELSRFELFDDKTWSSPAFAAPFLLVRSEREAACYELPLAPATDPRSGRGTRAR